MEFLPDRDRNKIMYGVTNNAEALNKIVSKSPNFVSESIRNNLKKIATE
jgi:hypothetical protein